MVVQRYKFAMKIDHVDYQRPFGYREIERCKLDVMNRDCCSFEYIWLTLASD